MNKINVIESDNVYEISFQYDPNVIELIKNVPGRRWNSEEKLWTIPSSNLGMLLNQFKGTVYEHSLNIYSSENIDVTPSLDVSIKIPDVDISDFEFQVADGMHPYKHQLDFIKYASNKEGKGFLLGDDMRLGKSLEVLNLALYRKQHNSKFKRCLIICNIATSRFNWIDDINKHIHSEECGYILGSRIKRNGDITYKDSKEKLEDLELNRTYGKKGSDPLPFYIITNIESIRYKAGKSYPIAEAIIDMVNSGEINMIAIDEVHVNMSPQSMQGKVISKIFNDTLGNVEWIPMSGTPITKSPIDLYLPLKLVKGHSFKSYWAWCQHYCIYGGYGNHDIISFKNIPEIKIMLQMNMLRRLKSQVHDMPPKNRIIEYVENTEYQKKLYKEHQLDLMSRREAIINSMNPMTELLILRQINGSPELVDTDIEIDTNYVKYNAKLQRLLDLIHEIVDIRQEKVIIYSNWVKPLQTLYKFISKEHKVCCFTGTMKEEVRQKHKRVFINNPNYKILIGTIGALGTAHTLTVANNVIFYDEPWNPDIRTQAEDRIYGLNTTKTANIYTILTKDTVDDRVHNILANKQMISDYMIDGDMSIRKNPQLFDMLLR